MRLIHATRAALLICASGPLVSCGGRSVATERTTASEAASCHQELAWQVAFSAEHGYALDALLPSETGYLVAGRRFETGRESAVILEIDEQGVVTWERHLEQEGALLASLGSGFVVAGSRRVGGRYREIVVTAFDASGAFRWEAVTGTEGDDVARSLVTQGYTIAVVGSSSRWPEDQMDVFASLVESSGQVRWARTYGEVTNQLGRSRDEFGVGGMFDAGGELVVVAMSWIDGGHGPLRLLALDAGGGVRWEYVDELESNRPSRWPSARTRDGGMVLAASLVVQGTTTGGSARVVRLDDLGAVKWTTRLGTTSSQQGVWSLMELEGGGIAAVGHYAEPGAAGTHLWQLSGTGELASTRAIEDEGRVLHGLGHVGQAAGEGFWLGGSEWSTAGPDLLRVARVGAQGRVEWKHELDGVGLAALDGFYVDASGRVLAAGYFNDDGVRESHVMMIREICDMP
jgi:hypothetical protein